MWYFSYDYLTSWREMIRFYRHVPPRVVLPQSRQPAVARNFRIAFPQFSEQFNCGAASIVSAAGKSVAGALYDLPRRAIEQLDEHYGRSLDWVGRDVGAYCRITIPVHPLRHDEPVLAIAHQANVDNRDHYPPSSRYIEMLVAGAFEMGHSSLWIEHLRSFAIQPADRWSSAQPGHPAEGLRYAS